MKKILLYLTAAVLLCSCGTQVTNTRATRYPKLYEEKPVTIVVMPPINQTNFVEAKDYFYTTLYMPLCEKGYYAFSPNLMMSVLQEQSAYDSEPFLDANLSMFKSALGADAAMFTIIKSWSRNNMSGSLTAGVEYILRSTKTGETLYQREGLITVDTSIHANTGGGLLGALINVAATAIATATTDKVEAGRRCTSYVLSDMPAGVYSPSFDKDQNIPAGDKFLKGTVR